MARRSRYFFTADCETDPFLVNRVPSPFIWAIYGGPDTTYREFATIEAFVEHIKDIDAIIYFHNGGKFDGFFLRGYANTDEPILIINGRLSRFKIGEAEIRDSMNILPVALKEFKKDKVDYAIMEASERDKPHNRILISDYLRGDCVYLHQLISSHRKEHGVTLTQASAALRASYKSKNIRPPSQTVSEFMTYRPFFAGGRVQCFEAGVIEGEDIECYDVNSAYPEAMRHPHPFSTSATVSDHFPPEHELHKSFVEFDGISKGGLYYRDDDGSMYYPDDNRVHRFMVTGYELIVALETNTIQIIRHVQSHTFPHTIDFKEFINTNWDKRKAAKALNDKAMSIIYKLNMNSAYGKNGADPTGYEEFLLATPDSIADWMQENYLLELWWTPERALMSRPLPDEKQRFYNVALAASVTGFQRGILWRGIQACEGVVYCDTDSIFARRASGLATGDELGQWKYEETFDACYIAGKKLYAMHRKGHPFSDDKDEDDKFLHWKIACKGSNLLPSEIVHIARGGTHIYAPRVPTFSCKLGQAVFIPRSIVSTAKDIRIIPE